MLAVAFTRASSSGDRRWTRFIRSGIGGPHAGERVEGGARKAMAMLALLTPSKSDPPRLQAVYSCPCSGPLPVGSDLDTIPMRGKKRGRLRRLISSRHPRRAPRGWAFGPFGEHRACTIPRRT